MSQFDLTGRTAIVTGGNGGIGRGIALGLAEAGADICIASRNQEKSAGVKAEVEALGRRCLTVACDVGKDADIAAAIEATKEAFGGFQILVNNAGQAAMNAPEAMTDDEWNSVVDINLSSVFKFCRSAHPEHAGARSAVCKRVTRLVESGTKMRTVRACWRLSIVSDQARQ